MIPKTLGDALDILTDDIEGCLAFVDAGRTIPGFHLLEYRGHGLTYEATEICVCKESDLRNWMDNAVNEGGEDWEDYFLPLPEFSGNWSIEDEIEIIKKRFSPDQIDHLITLLQEQQ